MAGVKASLLTCLVVLGLFGLFSGVDIICKVHCLTWLRIPTGLTHAGVMMSTASPHQQAPKGLVYMSPGVQVSSKKLKSLSSGQLAPSNCALWGNLQAAGAVSAGHTAEGSASW